ncbi:unnamed protein product [Amoebophrya sp. A25]|nr:unnamed protein product [Amoebophrya sp. A25]|eukprot:GSA25T00022300001.1
MATFCPQCCSLLLVDNLKSKLVCQTCPYQFVYTQKYYTKVEFSNKQVADVLGGPEAWKDVEKMNAQCPACMHGKAYFRQMQTRSADEPMTIFYRCEKCTHCWKED